MSINPVSAILQAITHWRDQRQRRKREAQARRGIKAGAAGKELLAEQQAWAQDFNERNRLLASNPDLAQIRRRGEQQLARKQEGT